MFWTIFSRRNIVIFTVVLLLGALIVAYARITYIEKDNELLKSNVKNLKEDVIEREKAITKLNDEVRLLIKEKEILEDTLRSNEEKIKAAEKVFTDIKEEFNISVEEILEDPDNYVITEDLAFSFDETNKECVPVKDTKTKPRQLNLNGQRKVSEKTINAMWQGYCHAYGCEK